MTTPIRGLLFDKDGTLLDFVASWGGVTEEALRRLCEDPVRRAEMALAVGYDIDAGRFVPGSPVVAGAFTEVAEVWAAFLPDWTAADVTALSDKLVIEMVETGALVPAVPDLAGYLHGLRNEGYVLGIATHDSEEAARAHMAGFDALEAFSFIAGYDSGHGLKPGPGMLLAFSRATGVAAHEVVMIGDSVHDLGVAPAAGAAMAVGVLTGPADHADLAPHADHVLASIGELPALLRSLRPAA